MLRAFLKGVTGFSLLVCAIAASASWYHLGHTDPTTNTLLTWAFTCLCLHLVLYVRKVV